MKTIYTYILLAFVCLSLGTSCQSDDTADGIGYLSLDVETVTLINPKTKALENYNPKQLAVRIVNAQGVVMAQTEDHTQWGSKPIALPIGSYTVQASSKGFDGQESGFDLPYYAGTAPANVEAGKNIPVTVTCTLANVKVTVNYSTDFKKYFKLATTTVSSKKSGINPLDFVMNTTTQSGYFPVADLGVTVKVTNMKDQNFSKSQDITGVQARDHYIINYRIAETGNGDISVEVDPTMKEYTFTFDVSTKASTSLQANTANAWSNLAYISGKILSAEGQLDAASMYFEYTEATKENWQRVPANTNDNQVFKATIKSLTPSTAYKYRMVYQKDANQFVSNEVSFTTETQNKIPNLGFDDWYKNGKHYYANANSTIFWDSGNEGANTLKENNPTSPEETDIISGKAARLGSITTAGQFAAGSLFTGDFGKASIMPLGAELSFGQPFTERPTQLTGHFKYSPGTVTHTKKDFIKKGDRDSCFVYIALTTWETPFQVNTGNNVFVNINDPAIIAYGELAKEKLSPATPMSNYEKFTIDLKYRTLEKRPTHILIVCTSSKYGDYFTGSTSSVLLLDEFDLVYGEPILE